MNSRQKLVQQQFLHSEEEVIKRLGQVYSKALKDITEKIEKLTFSIGKLEQEYDWMEPDDPKRAQVKSMIQSKIYQKKYQEQLQKQIEGILEKMQTSQFATVAEYLDECYTDGFIGTIFDAHGQGVPIISPIDQEAMVSAVQLESKISKGLYTRLGEDVALLKKKITAEVSRGIATGMTFSQVAKMLENQSRIGYNKAIRIARTEGHRIQCTSTMDAMKTAKERGCDVVKQWDSTLDARTRDSHVKLDGEIRNINERFSNGLMFPGDPNGAAAEVINCRCALLQRTKWALDDGEFTKFNGFTKQLESFDSPKDYQEFKDAFFSNENKQFMELVTQLEEKYGTKDFVEIMKNMTDKEYDYYSLLTSKNPIFIRKGLEKSSKSDIIRLGVIRDAVNSKTISLTVDAAKQNKHIVGSKGFIEGKSRLNCTIEDAQRLVDELKGTGTPVFDGNGEWLHKERVVCSEYIGIHVNRLTGEETKTNKLMIIYSKSGTHIVPRRGDD